MVVTICIKGTGWKLNDLTTKTFEKSESSIFKVYNKVVHEWFNITLYPKAHRSENETRLKTLCWPKALASYRKLYFFKAPLWNKSILAQC